MIDIRKDIIFYFTIILFIIVLSYVFYWRLKSRQIRLRNIIIPKQLLDSGFNSETLVSLLQINFEKIIPRKRNIQPSIIYRKHFKLLSNPKYIITGERIKVDIIQLNLKFPLSLFKPILDLIVRKTSTIVDINIYHNEMNNEKLTCAIYINSLLYKTLDFNFATNNSSNFNEFSHSIAHSIQSYITPPCILNSSLLSQNVNSDIWSNKNKLIAKQFLLHSQILNKLHHCSKGYCCIECSKTIQSHKNLIKCNSFKGYMLTPLFIVSYYTDSYNNSFNMPESIKKTLASISNFHNSFTKWYRFGFNRRFYKTKILLTHLHATYKHGNFIHNSISSLENIKHNKLNEQTNNIISESSIIIKLYKKEVPKFITPFTKSKQTKAYFHHNLGDIYGRIGKFDFSEKYFLKSLKWAKKRALTHLDLAILHLHNYKYDLCLKHLNFFLEKPDLDHITEAQVIMCLCNITKSINCSKNISDNSNFLHEQRDILSNILNTDSNIYHEVACCGYNLLAIIHTLLGENFKATACFQKALNLGENLAYYKWWYKSIIFNNQEISLMTFGITNSLNNLKNSINPVIQQNYSLVSNCVTPLTNKIQDSEKLFKNFRPRNNIAILSLSKNIIMNTYNYEPLKKNLSISLSYL